MPYSRFSTKWFIAIFIFTLLSCFAAVKAYAAYPTMTQLDSVQGTILDHDDSRILFIDSNQNLKLLERTTRSETLLQQFPPDFFAYPAKLFEDGVFFTYFESGTGIKAAEWKAGVLQDLGRVRNVVLSGDYAAIQLQSYEIIIRHLPTGTSQSITTQTNTILGDVNEAGEVAYTVRNPTSAQLYRYSGGVSTLLHTETSTSQAVPIFNVKLHGLSGLAYSKYSSSSSQPTLFTLKNGVEEEIASRIVNINQGTPHVPEFITPYLTRNGWVAYGINVPVYDTYGNLINTTSKAAIRSPQGNTTWFDNNSPFVDIVSINDNGEVVFSDGWGITYYVKPNGSTIWLSQDYDNNSSAIYRNGVYYFSEKGRLYQINTQIVPVTGISISPNVINTTLNQSSYPTLLPSFTPANASNRQVIWSSSDLSIVEINDLGHFQPKRQGTATVTATTYDGSYQAMVTINVSSDRYYPVTGIKWLSASEEHVNIGDSVKFFAVAVPYDATDKTILWSSSNPQIATVDSTGVVTAVNQGQAMITATTREGGFQASGLVIVPDNTPPSLTSMSMTVSGAVYTAVFDDINKEIQITLPQIMFNSATHFLTHISLQSSPDTNRIELTVGGQQKSLLLTGSSTSLSAQQVFGVQADPEGDGIPICKCQQIIKNFPFVTGVLFDHAGNQSSGTYRVKLNFN